MIVVDSNVLAYCLVPGRHTDAAHRVMQADPEWHAPLLWRSELRSVLCQYLRRGTLSLQEAMSTMATAEAMMAGREHVVPSAPVLELAAFSGLSAYDCEFVAVAEALQVPLVTEDAALSRAFPARALSMEAFVASQRRPPGAHAPRVGYVARRRGKAAGAARRGS